MTVLFIGYDLFHKDGADYENLEDAIKKLGSWWHCLDSTWLVDTETSAVDAREKLKPYLGKGDKLVVIKMKTPTAWASNANVPANCNDWLRDHVSENA